VPTDLSEHSLRAVEYAARLAMENRSELMILHVANDFAAWELSDEAFGYSKTWPLDRVFAEAALELNRFLELNRALLGNVHTVTKRLALGPVCQQIVAMAEQEKADLIVLSPRRQRKWWPMGAGTTERVTRTAPCPVLSVNPPLPSLQWRGKSLPAAFRWSRPTVESA
jgi:nucleotide-binding universal stress UspA family protein